MFCFGLRGLPCLSVPPVVPLFPFAGDFSSSLWNLHEVGSVLLGKRETLDASSELTRLRFRPKVPNGVSNDHNDRGSLELPNQDSTRDR